MHIVSFRQAWPHYCGFWLLTKWLLVGESATPRDGDSEIQGLWESPIVSGWLRNSEWLTPSFESYICTAFNTWSCNVKNSARATSAPDLTTAASRLSRLWLQFTTCCSNVGSFILCHKCTWPHNCGPCLLIKPYLIRAKVVPCSAFFIFIYCFII